MKPYVSVVMPSLNVVGYIEECIESVLNQTLHNIEIICVDAGSTDGTREKIEEYAKKDKRVCLIESEKKSYGYQVNTGIRLAQGEYIGIVETDDYVDEKMFEHLYKIANDTKADYVKADYDEFYEYPDGYREYNTVKVFREANWFKDKLEYHKIYCPQQILYLYTHDYYVWKGIYNREFLLNNSVFFNESKGAAYQDIGFTQLLHACAKTAYYTDYSGYRYRLDREVSSSNNGKGLTYAYQEFKRLIETPELFRRLVCKEGLYLHMMMSFNGEYPKFLRALHYDINDASLNEYRDWFKGYINKCLNNQDIWNEEGINFCNHIKKILDGNCIEDFKIQDEQRKKIFELLSATKGKKCVVFGAGMRGERMIKTLRNHNLNVVSLTDNNKEIWGSKKYELEVFSPQNVVKEFPDAVFIIANKNSGEDIKQQLEQMGILSESIIVNPIWDIK